MNIDLDTFLMLPNGTYTVDGGQFPIKTLSLKEEDYAELERLILKRRPFFLKYEKCFKKRLSLHNKFEGYKVELIEDLLVRMQAS